METVKELAKILEGCDCKHSAEHCDTCPYIGEEGCLSYFETAKKLVEHGVTIATDTNDKWVSVDERLPTEEEISRAPFGRFLVSIFGVILEAVYVNGYFAMSGGRLHSVSHWMNYPEPPKGVQ